MPVTENPPDVRAAIPYEQSGLSAVMARQRMPSSDVRLPDRAGREGVLGQRRGLQGRAVSRVPRWHIAAIADHDRVDEVLVQMVDILDHPVVQRGGNGD